MTFPQDPSHPANQNPQPEQNPQGQNSPAQGSPESATTPADPQSGQQPWNTTPGDPNTGQQPAPWNSGDPNTGQQPAPWNSGDPNTGQQPAPWNAGGPHATQQGGYQPNGYDAQQPYPQQNYPQQSYPQQGYEQQGYSQPAYAAGPAGPQGPQGPGGPWGPQPSGSNKKPLIIGGAILAVVAIVATVLIIVLTGKDDDDKNTNDASGGSQGAASGSGGSSKTCEGYGVEIDPETGDMIECTPASGDEPGAGADSPEVAAIEGTWDVTTSITSIDGELLDGDYGYQLEVGDSLWSGQHEWMIITPFCTESTSCEASVSDFTSGETFTLTSDNGTWVADSTLEIDCGDGSSDPMNVTIEIGMDDSDSLTGTITTTSSSVCGGEPINVVEDVFLQK